jgi:hypothetical protein
MPHNHQLKLRKKFRRDFGITPFTAEATPKVEYVEWLENRARLLSKVDGALANTASLPCRFCKDVRAGYQGRFWHDYCFRCGNKLLPRQA